MQSHRYKHDVRRGLAVTATIVSFGMAMLVDVSWLAPVLVAITAFSWWRASAEKRTTVAVEVVRELIARARDRDEDRRLASFDEMEASLKRVESLAADAYSKLHENDNAVRGTISNRDRLTRELAQAAWTDENQDTPAMRLERVRSTLNHEVARRAEAEHKPQHTAETLGDAGEKVEHVIELVQELLDKHASAHATVDEGVVVASPDEVIARYQEFGVASAAVLLRVATIGRCVREALEDAREEVLDAGEADKAALADAGDEVKEIMLRWQRIQDAARPIICDEVDIENKFNERMIAMQFEDLIRQTSEDVRARLSDERDDDGLLATLDEVCSKIDDEVEVTELLDLLDDVAYKAEFERRQRVSQESLDTGDIDLF